MNRPPLKFRAWDRKWKRWISGTDLTIYGDGTFDADRRAEPNGDVIETASELDLEVEQFTGLLDKTGKEIFEGDIVKMPGQWFHEKIGSDGRRMSEPPEWVNEEVRAPIGQHLFAAGDWSVEPEVCEVVGNIHSNPDLLNGGKT